jgi:hypothetical protein
MEKNIDPIGSKLDGCGRRLDAVLAPAKEVWTVPSADDVTKIFSDGFSYKNQIRHGARCEAISTRIILFMWRSILRARREANR